MILDVENIHTQFESQHETVRAVNGVSLSVDKGEVVGIVGESGCGKSVTARSIARLEGSGTITRGSIRFGGVELTEADDATLRDIRGSGVSMVFQDPETTLNPAFEIGEQVAESLRVHGDKRQRLLEYLHLPLVSPSWRDERDRAVELMEEVGISNPEERARMHPHEFSGGMRQRAVLAIALASEPDLLIADEPTTALDTTTQARVLDILRELNRERGMGVLLISHDIGVVAELCDRVVVMYAGEVMERGAVEDVLTSPEHPYTEALLGCLTQTADPGERLETVDGSVPEMTDEDRITGCPFAPRCAHATEACTEDVPIREITGGRAETHEVACVTPASERQAESTKPDSGPETGVREETT